MSKSIYTFNYDHPKDRWILHAIPVIRETEKYVFVERQEASDWSARLSKKTVCFTAEEALERFIRAMEQGILLKQRRIQHMEEGRVQAAALLEMNRGGDWCTS